MKKRSQLRESIAVLENPIGKGMMWGLIAAGGVVAAAIVGITLYEEKKPATTTPPPGGQPFQWALNSTQSGQPQTVHVGDTLTVQCPGVNAGGVTTTYLDGTVGSTLKRTSPVNGTTTVTSGVSSTLFTYSVAQAGTTTLTITPTVNGVALPPITFPVTAS